MKTFYTLLSASTVLILVLICPGVRAQYTPGGLGNSNLKLWLTGADATTLLNPGGTQAANGDYIAKWKDKSGNGNDAVQTASSTQPVLQTGALNGNAAVLFQNYNELLTGPSGSYQTIVAVRSLPGSGHYQSFFASPANTDFSIRGGGGGTTYTDGPNVNDWTYNTSYNSLPTQWTNGVQTLNASTTNHILVASAANPTNATYSINSTFLSRGMNANDPVYEILAYNGTLNNTQRMILENYEAVTWGLESALPASGYTVFTPPTTATFNKNLIAIGSISTSDNMLSNAAAATDGLGFSSTTAAGSFLNSPGFVMAAHNGQANTVIANASIPNIHSSNPITIWNRSWYVQKSGGNASGSITMSFNFTQYNSSTPSTTAVYALIYNAANGSFSSGANKIVTTPAPGISGGTVSFTVNASNLANGYYTVAYSTSVLALQITGLENTVQQNGSVLLSWNVLQDDADHFNIQRSTDGTNFTTIGVVDDKQDGQQTGLYTYVDATPAGGTDYYRIQVVESNGATQYSGISVANILSGSNISIHVYPNPVADRLHITAAGGGSIDIRIIDIQGRVLRQVAQAPADGVDIPVNDLGRGIYMAEIVIDGSRTTREFVKK